MTVKKQLKPQGKIIPNGVSLEKHENDIVIVFTNLGYDVELIPTARQRKTKTADAIIAGLEWEFKTPREGSTHALDRILRKATTQSQNVIVDIRLLKIPNDTALRRIAHVSRIIKTLQHLKVVAKTNKIIDIKQLTSYNNKQRGPPGE